MRVVAVSQVYAPDPTAAFLEDLARHWAEKGHDVTVLTANGPSQRDGHLWVRQVAPLAYGRTSILRRGVSNVVFAFGAHAAISSRLAARGPVDVVLFVGSSWLASVLPTKFAKRWIHWVHDIYPDALLALNDTRTARVFAQPARALLDATWSRADRIVVLSQSMRDRLVTRLPLCHVDMIPLWALPGWSERSDRSVKLRRERKIEENAFVILHHGNLGLAYEFGPLFAAARQMRGRRDILFALVGKGGQRRSLERRAKLAQLDNVLFFDPVPPHGLTDSLAIGDVHFIGLRDQWEGISYPSKLVAALALGRPVLLTGAEDGEVARTIVEGGCGLSLPSHGVSLREAVLKLRNDEALRNAMGQRSHFMCKKVFSRESALAKWDAIIAS